MLNKVVCAAQPDFFGIKGNKNEGSRGFFGVFCKVAGQLHHHGRAGGIVVGPVEYPFLPAAVGPVTYMIVVGANDDIFVAKPGIMPLNHAYDVGGIQVHACMAQLKRLKIGAIDIGLHARGFEVICNVVHGYFAATRTGRTPLKRIGGQQMYVVRKALGQSALSVGCLGMQGQSRHNQQQGRCENGTKQSKFMHGRVCV